MDKNLIMRTEEDFESIKHADKNGVEFWYARELMIMLEYSKRGNFIKVIDKAKESCKNSNIKIVDHFADVGKMVKAGVADKEIDDLKLTRYACITHNKVGQAVRQTIKRIGSTMPEDLPTPSKSAKQIAKEQLEKENGKKLISNKKAKEIRKLNSGEKYNKIKR